jgi:hypothetical protein
LATPSCLFVLGIDLTSYISEYEDSCLDIYILYLDIAANFRLRPTCPSFHEHPVIAFPFATLFIIGYVELI